jgi:inorganic pyrophosphatase
MVDASLADDKIVAVLESDTAYGGFEEVAALPPGIIERLRHYFLSYKQLPGDTPRQVSIPEIYDRLEAHDVINRSLLDYRETFGSAAHRIQSLRHILHSR